MSGVVIRQKGPAGRITLDRPDALNALTLRMIRDIETALGAWSDDPTVTRVVIDGVGPRAFCAGGDIAEMYRTATAGDHDYGRLYWADEYRLNALIAGYPKPYIAFMHGYVMGGGVGVSAHGSHRIVCESSRVAMPECAIGLVPDVGGSLLLAMAPGGLSGYLGLTGHRMTPGMAILAGFADTFVPADRWPGLIAALESGAPLSAIADAADPPPDAGGQEEGDWIDRAFLQATASKVRAALRASPESAAQEAADAIDRASPLSVACAHEIVTRVRAAPTLDLALELERRFTWRAAEHGDFVEGIRAAIIDRDNVPRWRHSDLDDVTRDDIEAMLAPV